MVKFRPLDDKESFLIQSADTISNFFLNLIRHLIGIENDIYEKKAQILIESELFENCYDEIRKNFKEKDGKAICINEDLKVSIKFEVH